MKYRVTVGCVTDDPHRRFFGARLRYARKAARLTRMDLAKAIDFLVSPQTIGRYEAEQTDISFDVALRIADVLKVNVEELTDATS